MNQLFKLILTAIILTLALNASFAQLTHTIELSLNRTTGELYDPGETQVHKGDLVIWKIKPGENIRSFNVRGVGHPFRGELPDPNSDYSLISRVVDRNGRYDWKYKIFYRLTTSPRIRRQIDPKIAVRPQGAAFTEVVLLSGFIASFMAAIIFFRKWRSAENRIRGK